MLLLLSSSVCFSYIYFYSLSTLLHLHCSYIYSHLFSLRSYPLLFTFIALASTQNVSTSSHNSRFTPHTSHLTTTQPLPFSLSPKMDPFERIPVELMLCILRDTDFVGLEALLEVSQFVRDLFRVNCIQIIGDVLASCPSTSYDLHLFFRTVTMIRTPSMTPLGFNEYKPYSAAAMSLREYFKGSPVEADTTLYGMVKIAARIQQQPNSSSTCALSQTAEPTHRFGRGRRKPPVLWTSSQTGVGKCYSGQAKTVVIHRRIE